MRKKILFGLVVALSLTIGGGIAFAHYMGFGGYGGHMMGPSYYGHMGGPGFGGPMMGPDYEGYCERRKPEASAQKPITEKETELILRDYIGRNPNLKVGEIKDKGTYFEGEIITKNNSLVTRLRIDKNTGWVQPLY